MDWLSQNWFWVFVFVAFMAMHIFGHGGHGGHSQRQEGPDAAKEGSKNGGQKLHHHH